MCTAATYQTKGFYMGRTLDYEFSYGDEITVTPRHYEFQFRHMGSVSSHYAMIGMAHVAGDYPLYYDAMNEKGLGMAGLNFVGNADFQEVDNTSDNIAQFEFIPWILCQCATLEEAKKLLIASFVEAGIRVLGVDEAQIVAEEEAKEKADISEEEQGAIRFYEEELEQMDLPGEEEQKELIHAWLVEKGDGEAVIESFLPQILEIARTHTGKGVLFGDLVQEGNIGLLEAMAIYQGKDAEGFLAHAKSAVEDSILDAIAIQRGSDSVGEAMAIKANRLDDASTFLSKELGREPKIEELAKYLSMTEEEVKEVMKISLDALSVMEADIKQS